METITESVEVATTTLLEACRVLKPVCRTAPSARPELRSLHLSRRDGTLMVRATDLEVHGAYTTPLAAAWPDGDGGPIGLVDPDDLAAYLRAVGTETVRLARQPDGRLRVGEWTVDGPPLAAYPEPALPTADVAGLWLPADVLAASVRLTQPALAQYARLDITNGRLTLVAKEAS